MPIRPLVCLDTKSNESGICMFSMDCRRLNGKSLGVCGDRFYFGSCCVTPEMEKEKQDEQKEQEEQEEQELDLLQQLNR